MKKTKLAVVKRRELIFSIIFYVLAGLIFAFGFALALTDIIGNLIHVYDNNPIWEAMKATPDILGMHLDWRYYGLMLIGIGTLIFTLTVFYTSKKSDSNENLEKSRSKRVSLNLESMEKKEEELKQEN